MGYRLSNNSAEQLCRNIYTQTALWYDDLRGRRGDIPGYGYKILYGPPHFQPPILFIGYQPGGGVSDAAKGETDGERSGWPCRCEYSTATWTLARWLRRVVGVETLDRCVGLNAIFLRSRSIKEYERDLDAQTRAEVWKFCKPMVQSIAETLNPRCIVLLGFSTARLFGEFERDAIASTGRPLALRGYVGRRSALSVLHPSARMSVSNREIIAKRIRSCPSQDAVV